MSIVRTPVVLWLEHYGFPQPQGRFKCLPKVKSSKSRITDRRMWQRIWSLFETRVPEKSVIGFDFDFGWEKPNRFSHIILRLESLSNFSRVASRFGISVWYRSVFSRYFTNRYRKKTRSGRFGIVHLAGTPFFPSKGGFCPLFLVKKKFPPNLQKGVPAKFHKMELPPNLTVQKIPTEYTNRLVPVTYWYQPNCQYTDRMQL